MSTKKVSNRASRKANRRPPAPGHAPDKHPVVRAVHTRFRRERRKRLKDSYLYREKTPQLALIKEAVVEFLRPLIVHQRVRADQAPDEDTRAYLLDLHDGDERGRKLLPDHGDRESGIADHLRKKFRGISDRDVDAALKDLVERGIVTRTMTSDLIGLRSGPADPGLEVAVYRLADGEAESAGNIGVPVGSSHVTVNMTTGPIIVNQPQTNQQDQTTDTVVDQSADGGDGTDSDGSDDDAGAGVLVQPMLEQPTPPPGGDSDDAMLSATDLAEMFKVSRDALRKRLERFRKNNHKGWIEVQNRGPREPLCRYHLGTVRPIIAEMQKSTSSGASSQRPAKKN